MPRKPSAGPLSAGSSQNQSIEPCIKQTTSGNSAAPATAASRPGRRRAGSAAITAAAKKTAKQEEPDDSRVGQQPQLEAVGPRGLVRGVSPRHVIVGEVVLAEPADGVRDEGVKSHPPEVVAAAPDVGEMRAGGGLRVAETGPHQDDEPDRMSMGCGLGAHAEGHDGERSHDRPDGAPASQVGSPGREQRLAPGQQRAQHEYDRAYEQRRVPGARGGVAERGPGPTLL